MAINADFFTVEGVTNIADLGELCLNAAIRNMNEATETNGLIAGVIKKLENVKKELKDERDKVLSMLHAVDEKEVRERVNTFYAESGLKHFTGIDLASIIEGYSQAKDKGNKQRYDVLIGLLMKNASIDTQRAINGYFTDKTMQDEIINNILSVFNTQVDKEFGAKKRNSEAYLTKTTRFAQFDEKGVLHILVSRLTEAQKRNLINYIDSHEKDLPDLTGAVSVHNDLIEMGLHLGNQTETLTKKQAKNKFTPREISNRNREIIKLILQFIDPKYHQAATALLEYMLRKDPRMFFVGYATTQITGLLGEVGTLFAIDYLLNGHGNTYGKYASWVAEEKDKGKQLSIDVIFKEEGIPIGVQSKNTSLPEDLKEKIPISFASGRIELIFERLFGFEWTDFSNVMISNSFNVPYRKLGPYNYEQVPRDFHFEQTPFPKNFPEYVRQDERIEQLNRDICLFLTQFTPNFLYMSAINHTNNGFSGLLATLDDSLDIKGNFMYMVGDKVQFATEILERIISNLEFLQKIQSGDEELDGAFKELFSLSISFKQFDDDDKKAGFNIVDYYNKHIGQTRSLKDYNAILTSAMIL